MDSALVTLARSQGGVFTTAQAARIGIPRRDLHDLVRRGWVVRLRQAAYVLAEPYAAATASERFRLTVAAVCLGRPGACASHHAALVVHGLPLYGVDLRRIDLAISCSRSYSRSGVHTHALLAGEQRVLVGGLPAVSAATAVVQTMVLSGLEPALVAGDAALHRGLTTLDGLQATGVTTSRRAWDRLGTLLDLLDPATESPGESRTRLLVRGLGLASASQVEIRDGSGAFVARVDLLVEGCVVVEFDGLVKYAGAEGRDALVAEKVREDRLRDLGYEVVRLVWADLAYPEIVARRIREALARAQAWRARSGSRPRVGG